ncbi:hypothetical protein A6V39_05120 [Candidatus Mycoplasma haematobovis]|uniref:Uncharacterized protein n=1 Tax=Candidatus Mycoplasma haematobovis TaxID=432608 RepID=A0A1A9QDP0_9MOLU|nr:hypothetical protein [Candidatus Mycoplasma haematobovis]OAL09809.1 hypothetical protein A6V39_05120 [Candidatus Mycoplasma haematobovis]
MNAKAWCIVPKIRLLGDKLENKLHEGTAWQTKFAEFSKELNGNNKFLEALNVGVDRDKLTKDSQNGGEKLRDWCNSAVNLKVYVEDAHKTETNVKAWCLSDKKK